MILRTTIAGIRLTFSLARIAKIMGVNSKLDDSKRFGTNEHILMWDFDNQPLTVVEDNLKVIQTRYFLSDIHILETNNIEGNFIAYCFTRTDWQRAIEIISATRGIDWNFVRLSVYRGWFTLRVGEKKSGKPHLVSRLEGFQLPDCSPEDMQSWVEYETLDKE